MKENKTYILTTEFEEKMDRDIPWNFYPRPQLKRDSFICLNGSWDFCVKQDEGLPKNYGEKILVPFPVESRLSGIERRVNKNDILYYRRTFTLPDGFMKDKLYLRFGAVDRLARIFVNGEFLGIHNCGYTPFYADITSVLRDGENEIVVEVRDNLSPIYPYGKQKNKRGGMWYTPVSGIWQTVWLESLPKEYIESIRITPTLDNVKIQVSTEAKNKRITLIDSGESFDFTDSTIVIEPKKIRYWSPEDPYLYRFRLTTDTDEIESYFALREISSEMVNGKPRLCLNGKPYLFNGLLDQGYFPDGIFLPATPEGYEKDILLAKSMGFNTLRKHIKVEPQIFYYLCDTLGIAVFQDMVNNSKYSFFKDTVLPTIGLRRRSDSRMHNNIESRAAFKKCMKETVNLLYNFPSVVYYTIFNEGWGQFDSELLYAKLCDMDQTRIVDSASGWFTPKESDVDSRHIYFRKPVLSVGEDRPLVLSEFGGYSHRVKDHLFGEKNYGYTSYDSREDFENAVCELYSDGVLPLVDEGISALIYTQISDVEDETNGFITYDRRVVKINVERMKKISDLLYSRVGNGGEN